MRGDATAKSTFVAAPSFASSSSVTSINHVLRLLSPVLSRNSPLSILPDSWPTHAARSYRVAHPIFHYHPVPFPFYQFLPFFSGPLLYVLPAGAHIIPEVHSSSRNEISRIAALRLLCHISSTLIIFQSMVMRQIILHHDMGDVKLLTIFL